MIRVVLWASGSAAVGSLAEPIFRQGLELSVIGHLVGDCEMAWDLFDEAAERGRTGYLALMDEAEHESDA